MTKLTCVSASKGETQINDQLTGFGRWEAEFAGNNDETTSGQKTRLAFAGLKIKDFGSLDYGRNPRACCTM